MSDDYSIRRAEEADDDLLCAHYLAIWDSYGVPRAHHRADARSGILAFLRTGREARAFGGFLAVGASGVAGSACCEVRRSPYPEVLRPDLGRTGYVWSVYVAPDHRRRGLAERLVRACVDHLAAAGCTAVDLHGSDAGLPLYEAMGFRPTAERSLDLRRGDDG